MLENAIGGAKRLKVLCPISNAEGKTFWRLMGTGFPNKDGSINIYLDGLPVNGKLQLREWDEVPPWERDKGGGERRSRGDGEMPSQPSLRALEPARDPDNMPF